MELFFPESKEELDYIGQAFATATTSLHVGFRGASEEYGIFHSDYTLGVGIHGVTHSKNGSLLFAAGEDLMGGQKCLFYDLATEKLSVETTCGHHKAACKTKLGEISNASSMMLTMFYSEWPDESSFSLFNGL